jgi:hypothetical protein
VVEETMQPASCALWMREAPGNSQERDLKLVRQNPPVS